MESLSADKKIENLTEDELGLVLKQLTDHNLPESAKSPLVQRLNAEDAQSKKDSSHASLYPKYPSNNNDRNRHSSKLRNRNNKGYSVGKDNDGEWAQQQHPNHHNNHHHHSHYHRGSHHVQQHSQSHEKKVGHAQLPQELDSSNCDVNSNANTNSCSSNRKPNRANSFNMHSATDKVATSTNTSSVTGNLSESIRNPANIGPSPTILNCLPMNGSVGESSSKGKHVSNRARFRGNFSPTMNNHNISNEIAMNEFTSESSPVDGSSHYVNTNASDKSVGHTINAPYLPLSQIQALVESIGTSDSITNAKATATKQEINRRQQLCRERNKTVDQAVNHSSSLKDSLSSYDQRFWSSGFDVDRPEPVVIKNLQQKANIIEYRTPPSSSKACIDDNNGMEFVNLKRPNSLQCIPQGKSDIDSQGMNGSRSSSPSGTRDNQPNSRLQSKNRLRDKNATDNIKMSEQVDNWVGYRELSYLLGFLNVKSSKNGKSKANKKDKEADVPKRFKSSSNGSEMQAQNKTDQNNAEKVVDDSNDKPAPSASNAAISTTPKDNETSVSPDSSTGASKSKKNKKKKQKNNKLDIDKTKASTTNGIATSQLNVGKSFQIENVPQQNNKQKKKAQHSFDENDAEDECDEEDTLKFASLKSSFVQSDRVNTPEEDQNFHTASDSETVDKDFVTIYKYSKKKRMQYSKRIQISGASESETLASDRSENKPNNFKPLTVNNLARGYESEREYPNRNNNYRKSSFASQTYSSSMYTISKTWDNKRTMANAAAPSSKLDNSEKMLNSIDNEFIYFKPPVEAKEAENGPKMPSYADITKTAKIVEPKKECPQLKNESLVSPLSPIVDNLSTKFDFTLSDSSGTETIKSTSASSLTTASSTLSSATTASSKGAATAATAPSVSSSSLSLSSFSLPSSKSKEGKADNIVPFIVEKNAAANCFKPNEGSETKMTSSLDKILSNGANDYNCPPVTFDENIVPNGKENIMFGFFDENEDLELSEAHEPLEEELKSSDNKLVRQTVTFQMESVIKDETSNDGDIYKIGVSVKDLEEDQFRQMDKDNNKQSTKYSTFETSLSRHNVTAPTKQASRFISCVSKIRNFKFVDNLDESSFNYGDIINFVHKTWNESTSGSSF